jgi:hypothetical protein
VLVELGLVEQRYQAVLEVLSGVTVTEVAGRFGVTRQSVHRWRLYSTRSASLGRTRPALQAGPAASTFAPISVAGTTSSTAPTGTMAGETLPTLSVQTRPPCSSARSRYLMQPSPLSRHQFAAR